MASEMRQIRIRSLVERMSESTNGNRSLLSLEDLHVEFPTREGVVRAVRGATFHVSEGETLGLVGESGCGKTVCSQAILRIVPSPGRIVRGRIVLSSRTNDVAARSVLGVSNVLAAPYAGTVSGDDSTGDGSAVDLASLGSSSYELKWIRRNEIAMIMQEPMSALSPVHTIGNQIMERIRLSSELTKADARDRCIELLEQVGLPDAKERIDRYSFELSGGMRQRAMIAMALAGDPRLLIADEPTTAVDVTIQAQILRLLKQLQDQLGMAILMITHDLSVVANVAHRVAVMYRGRVVETGSVRQVLREPKHPYTRGLIACIPDIASEDKGRIKTIKGVVPHPYAVVNGCQFHPRCSAFMRGTCDRLEPEDYPVDGDHVVACHLYGEENERAE